MRRFTLAEALCLLAVGGLVVEACRPQAPASTGDTLRDLALAIESAEAAVPLARASCALVPSPDQRRYCEGSVDAVEEAALVGRQLLASVEACREEGDEECVLGAVEAATRLLRVLRPPHPQAAPARSGP